MSILKRFEKHVDEKLRSAFSAGQGPAPRREMIEVYRAILDDVAGRIQTGARGRKSFPFNHVVIKVAAPDDEARAVYDAMFGTTEFHEDVRGALAEAGVEAPSDLTIEVQRETAELPNGYHIGFGKRDLVPPEKPSAIAHARLRVMTGAAEQTDYEMNEARLNIGRLADVVDDQQRLVRRNHIVFLDASDGPNSTVSRAHAHIVWDSAAGQFRLFDDNSAFGTSIFRDGALLHVPAGATRGVALRNGDDIYVGQARLGFALE